MGKTADLCKLITTKLNTISEAGGTYHRIAPDNAVHPYKVFTLSRVNLADLARDDLDLQIDIYDHGTDDKRVNNIADAIEDLFNAENLPQATILPTFFRDSRYPVTEDDKTIQHVQLHIAVQNYTL